MPAADFSQILTSATALVSALGAAVSAAFAIRTVNAQNNAMAQASNLQALSHFIINSYANRTPIRYGKDMQGASFVDDRDEVRKKFIANPAEWRSSYSATEPSRYQTISNEISHSLQHLGLAVFVGVVPLKLILADIGDSLVLDWLVVKEHIEDYWQLKQLHSTKFLGTNYKVNASRRHGEWLALVAFLWLQKNWHYTAAHGGTLTQITAIYGGQQAIEHHIRNITEADREIVADSTIRDVRKILGLKI